MSSYPPIAPAGPSTSGNATSIASSPSTSRAVPPSTGSSSSGQPPKKKRRSKVDSACRFCRRSHMQCSGERPCVRCIKREIAHLCTDEPIVGLDPPQPPPPPAAAPQPAVAVQTQAAPSTEGAAGMMNTLGLDMGGLGGSSEGLGAGRSQDNPLAMMQGSLFAGGSVFDQPSQQQSLYQPVDFNMAMLDLANDGLGAGLGLDMTTTGEGEFHGLGLSEFLQSLNDAPLYNPANAAEPSAPQARPEPQAQIGGLPINTDTGLTVPPGTAAAEKDRPKSADPSVPGSPINKTERFLLTAADQKDGSRSDRLARVIHAKFEAGLLRPYNHVAGYTRLMKYMADKYFTLPTVSCEGHQLKMLLHLRSMSASARQRTLHTLSEFRPTFRAIASGLTDLDLVFIEEAFERLLLDYDRVFSSMGIPSCLWRRTGEIYKGNKEFAALVGVPIEHLQGGKLAIYELMAEESAVNYWEKYGNVAFDAGQKAVLTSCVLIKRPTASSSSSSSSKRTSSSQLINACFSFTLRRDAYNIPSAVVGNFIPL